jgi:hypothetical protein
LRFILAIVSFVVAFVLIGFGIAQRTILAEADHVLASTVVTSSAPVTVIDSKTLRSLEGRQKIEISGSSKVFAAYGRTDDVLAWIGDTRYNKIGFDAENKSLTSKLVDGKSNKVPNPQGSDLWLDEYSKDSSLQFTVNVPAGISVIIVSDGVKPAPSHIAIRWPLDNRTPWSGPLILGGVVLLLAGLGFYLWALAHLRRMRGPRRNTPKNTKMPKPPRPKSYKPSKSTGIEVKSGRRSTARRMTAVIPVLLAGTVVLSGCSSELWPEFLGGAASTPSASPSPIAPVDDNAPPPAVTLPQVKGIVAKIVAVAAKADADHDSDVLKTRFEGPALQLREANYAIRKVDNSVKPLSAIPGAEVRYTLPQQVKGWPRVVLTVVRDTDVKVPPVVLMLVQKTARDNFKVDYALSVPGKTLLPKIASDTIGAPLMDPDNKFTLLAPSQLATAYGDLLAKGSESVYAKLFDTSRDDLIKMSGTDAKAARKAALPPDATTEFSNAAGPGASIALGTSDSGALVAVNLNELETVKPPAGGASLGTSGGIKSLSGVTSTLKGITSTYGGQLLFYVPPANSTKKIVLLGFSEGLVSATELP